MLGSGLRAAAWLVFLGALPAPAFAGPVRSLCVPSVGEKLGVRFIEVCPARAGEVFDDASGGDRALPGFWISATPLPCSHGSHETLDCPTVTALEASPVGSRLRNRPMRASVLDAETAHRICTLRFGGRLPTAAEREHARHALGLVSLLVREEAAQDRRVAFDELPEWVAAEDCERNPSTIAPECRVSLSPPIVPRPRREGDALLACDAEIADFGSEPSVAIGGSCELGIEAERRRPRCAAFVPHAAYPSRFTLACRDATPEVSEAAARPTSELAAFRCVLPRRALGSLGEPVADRSPPRAP